jgi:hypothetical protein
MIFSSIIAGLYRSWGIKRIILLYILLSLLVSSLVLNPYINTFQEFFSHRLAAEVIAQANIYTYYLEFSHYLAPAVEAARSVISLGAFLFLIISVLLSGGVIDSLISPEPVRLRKFWSQSGHFFGRMIRLLLFSILLIAAALLVGILIPLPFTYLLPNPFVENVYFYFYAGWLLFIWLLFVIVFALLDLAKVLIVRDERDSVLRAVVTSFRYTVRHPLQILMTYLVLYLVGVLFFALYWWMQHFISNESAMGIFWGIAFLQIFVFLQYWIKFSRYGALYQIVENMDMEVVG